MDLFSFIAEVVKALAWPGAVVFGLLVLRRPLLALVPTIRHLKVGELELEFGRQLVEAEKEAQAAKLPPASDPVLAPPDSSTLNQLNGPRLVARVHPRAAVLEAWILVERALQQAAVRRGLGTIRDFTRTQLEHLARVAVIPEETVGLIGHLRRLRNEAAHAADFAPTVAQAIEYAELAERLVRLIELRNGLTAA